MPLSTIQQEKLANAIQGYNFPMVAYDFANEKVLSDFATYHDLEQFIRNQLTSGDITEVKDGLSNVLYWGYATSKGRQGYKIENFRALVTDAQVRDFMGIVSNGDLSLQAIKQCKLPQLSNISFVSKVLMFLDPERFVTLDLQLRKLKLAQTDNLFRGLKDQKTSLPINKANELFYQQWCSLCHSMAERYFASFAARAVDVERGIFSLVRRGEIEFVAGCLTSA